MKTKTKETNKVTYLKAGECSCPVCNSKRIQGISRITGYMSLDERFGEGKVAERSLRVDHTSKHNKVYKIDK